jgi:hypothetical protein
MIEHASGDAPPSDPWRPLARGDHLSEDELVDLLCADQVKGWQAGGRIPAEAHFARHPNLAADSEGAFEFVYGEYLVRELLGEPPKLLDTAVNWSAAGRPGAGQTVKKPR